MKRVLLAWFMFTFAACITSKEVYAQAAEPVGGPYTKDANTVLLLHFENDYKNESSLSNDAAAHGKSQFFPVSAVPGLGQCLYLQNDSKTDSSFITVADNDNLDLSGDWTIEAWFNVQTFGTDNTDHRFAPVVMWKPGSPTFDQGNYFMEIFGNNRYLSTGYAVKGNGWPSVQSPNNTIVPQTWYHATLIRDTKNHVVYQLIHDSNLNLVYSGWFEYNPATQKQPIITDREIFIGTNGGSMVQPSFFDGFMDEIRISNIARNFNVPPAIVDVQTIPNQTEAAASYPPLRARIGKIGASEITKVYLNYKTGGGWQKADMTLAQGDSMYSVSLPLQSSGSIVYYYITAENAAGQKSVYPQKAEDPNSPSYLSFAVEKQNTQTLALEFEEGSSPAKDYSTYSHLVNLNGLPSFESGAIKGNYALGLHSDSRDYVEVGSSLIAASEEFSLDFWMNPTTMDGFWGFVTNKPAISPGMWGENTFEIIWGAFDDPGHKLTAGKFTPGEQKRVTLNYSLELGKWYHVIYEIRKAPAGDQNKYYLLFQINDSTDKKLASDFAGFNLLPDRTIHPVRIGEAAGRGVFFNGKIDAYHTYNYATGLVKVDAAPSLSIPSPLSNQTSAASEYTVLANVAQGLGTEVTSVKLNYNLGNGWQEAAMTKGTGNEYSAKISKQPSYAVVYYYVTAENASGFKSVYPADALSATSPSYLSFAVEEPNSKTLAMDFEAGTGNPVDESQYKNMVVTHGKPVFSTTAQNGKYSLEFDGKETNLEVYSPVLASTEEFAVDLWMNPANMSKYWSFILNKPGISVPSWGENTFEILYGAFDDPKWKLTAGVWNKKEGNTRITLPTLIEFNKWYHLLFEVKKADTSIGKKYVAIFELKDQNDQSIAKDYKGFDEPVGQSIAPMQIGKAGGINGWPEYYNGKLDKIQFYNYAALNLQTTGVLKGRESDQIPSSFELSQNYPNPFNPTTQIRFALPKESRVTLEIYDVLGKRVMTLVNEVLKAGTYNMQWNGRDQNGNNLSSGLYLYRISTESFSQARKMLLLK